jgi:hypothetical protein
MIPRGTELKTILSVSLNSALVTGCRYFFRNKLKRTKLKAMDIEVARAMPGAPRSLDKMMLRTMLSPTVIALMIKGLFVSLKE